MSLLNLNKREKALFYLALILILLGIGQRVIFSPIRAKWKQLDEKVSENLSRLKKSESILAKSAAVEEEYKKNISAVKATGSEEEEMTKFLSEIESLASPSSIHLIEIKPLPVKKTEPYKTYYVELEAEGGISQISKFMYDIENSPNLLTVDKFSLGAKESGTNLLKFHLVVTKLTVF